MAEEGIGFPWHFDTNNFTITLAIQNSDEGGLFQYAPHIRRSDENFDVVQKVLDGTSDKVVSLALELGDLQIFKGRYSLHRVSPLRGDRKRYVAIFSYVEEPDMVGAPNAQNNYMGGYCQFIWHAPDAVQIAISTDVKRDMRQLKSGIFSAHVFLYA